MAIAIEFATAGNLQQAGKYTKLVLEALDQAGLREWAQHAADGIHTQVGENASEMSGGERQAFGNCPGMDPQKSCAADG